MDCGNLVERHFGPVVLHSDIIQQAYGSSACPHRAQFLARVFDCAVHSSSSIVQDPFCIHTMIASKPQIAGAAWLTTVPIRSPVTTRTMLPGRFRLNTWIGRFRSRQRLMAD